MSIVLETVVFGGVLNLRLLNQKQTCDILAGGADGRNFDLKTYWDYFQSNPSFDSSLSGCSGSWKRFGPKTLWQKIGLLRLVHSSPKTGMYGNVPYLLPSQPASCDCEEHKKIASTKRTHHRRTARRRQRGGSSAEAAAVAAA